MKPNFKCIVLTTDVKGTPNMSSLVSSNPELDVAVETVKATGYQGWFNCDRNIRNWWKENHRDEKHDRFLFLEYDVLVDRDLSHHFPNDTENDVEVMGYIEGDLMCKSQSPKLRTYDVTACRISPLSVIMLTRKVLDAICKPEMDCIFNDMIYCEVRLPSVIRHLGYTLTVNPKLNAENGIHHPVK